MITPLQLRDARATDLPTLASLYERAGLDTPGFNQAARLSQAWGRLKAMPGVHVRVAESGNRLIGSLILFVLPFLAHDGTPAAIVDDVAVDPDLQGRGVGRRLLDDAMSIAAAEGCYKLALSSNRRREGAHAFYRSLGFEQHGLSFSIALESTS